MNVSMIFYAIRKFYKLIIIAFLLIVIASQYHSIKQKRYEITEIKQQHQHELIKAQEQRQQLEKTYNEQVSEISKKFEEDRIKINQDRDNLLNDIEYYKLRSNAFTTNNTTASNSRKSDGETQCELSTEFKRELFNEASRADRNTTQLNALIDAVNEQTNLYKMIDTK